MAQKVTSTTLPRSSEVVKVSPDKALNFTSGAGRVSVREATAASAAMASEASRAAPTPTMIFAFMDDIVRRLGAAVALRP